MANVNANININVNAGQAHAQLAKLTSQVNSLNKSFVGTNTAAASQQAALNRALRDSINVSGQFTTKIVPTTTAVDQFSNSLERSRLTLGQYTRNAASQLPGMSRIFRREFDNIGKLAESRVKTMQTQFINLGKSANGMGQALAATPTGLDRFSNSAAISIQRQQIFNKLLRDGSTQLLNWGKNTQWAGRQLMVGFTLPLAMFGAAASRTFRELEAQAINFRKVYGDIFTTPKEVEDNLQQVRALSKEYTRFGVAVKETMELAAIAAQAGQRGESLQAATEQATRLSILGQMQGQDAMRATIALQSAFVLSNEELTQSINFMNMVNNSTVLSLQDMAEAIPRVAPVIKGLGGDVKDMAVLLTAMREGGVSAAEGANGLKSSLGRLISPSRQAKEMAEGFGISLENIVQTNRGDLLGTITDLARAMQDLGDLEKQQLLSSVFGRFQFARMGALFDNIIREGSQAQVVIDRLGMSVEDLAGIADREMAAIEESTATKFTAAMEQLKLSLAPIGEEFLKAVTPLAEFVSKILSKFEELPGGLKTVMVGAAAIIGGVAPVLLMVIGLIANGIANLTKFINFIRKSMAILRGNAEAHRWNSKAELESAAASAALSGKVNNLTKDLVLQDAALKTLIASLRTYHSAASTAAAALPTTMGRMPIRRNAGGTVPGMGDKDTVPALLTPGEFVINKEQTQKNFRLLQAINEGRVVTRNTGGVVPPVDISQSKWEFSHAQEPTTLTSEQSDRLRSISGEKSPIRQTPGRLTGYSNFGLMLPAQANAQQMGAQQLSSLFKNKKLTSKIMAPLYVQMASDMGTTVDKLMKSTSPEMRAAKREIEKFSSRIGTEVAKLGTGAVTNDKFYKAVAKASTKDLPKVAAATSAMRQVTAVGTVDSGVTGRTKGQRVGLSQQMQREALRSERPVTSWRNQSKQLAAARAPLPAAFLDQDRAVAKSIARNQRNVERRERQSERRAVREQRRAEADRRLRRASGGAGGAGGGTGRVAGQPQDDGNRRRGMGGRGVAMGASMALGMGAMIPMLKQDEQGKFMGMDANTAMMAMFGASMAVPLLKGVMGAVAALAVALKVATGVVGAVAAALVAIPVAAFAIKKGFDNNIEAGIKLADAMTTNAQKQQEMADVFGTTTYLEKRRQAELSKMTGLTSEQLQEGREFVGTEQGQSMLESAKIGFEQQGKSFATTFATQLSQMVISGAITPSNAEAIAVGITDAVGRKDLTANVIAQINNILAPNGDDVTNSPLKIMGQIETNIALDEAALERAVGPKGPEDFNVLERLFSGDYDEAARNAVAFSKAVTANTRSIISSYDDQITAQDLLINSLDSKIEAEKDAVKQEELDAKRSAAINQKKALEDEKVRVMRERREKEASAFRRRGETVQAARKSVEEMGIVRAGVMFREGAGGIMGQYLRQAKGDPRLELDANEFEIKWLIDIESGRIDPEALQYLQRIEEQQKGSAQNVLQLVAELQFEGKWQQADQISVLASQMDKDILTVFNSEIKGPQGDDPEWVISYATLLNQLPENVDTEIAVDLAGLDTEDLDSFRESLESLQGLGIDVGALIESGGVDAIRDAVQGLEELEEQLASNKIQKGIKEIAEISDKDFKSRLSKQIEVVTELTDQNGNKITPDQVKLAQDQLMQQAGITEQTISELPPDVAVKVLAVQINAEQFKQMAIAERIAANQFSKNGFTEMAADATKRANAFNTIFQAYSRAATTAVETSGASMGFKPPEKPLPPGPSGDEEDTGGGGGGSGKQEDPFKNMIDSIMNQIKMYADATAKFNTLFNAKNKFFKVLQSQKGIDDQIRKAGLEGTILGSQIAGMDPDQAKEVLGKITGRGGRLNQQGRKVESAALLGSVALRTSQAQDSMTSSRAQFAAMRDLQGRGLATSESLELIAQDAGAAKEYVGLIKQAKDAEKAWIDAGSKRRGKAWQEWRRAQKAVQDYVNEISKAAAMERAIAAEIGMEIETQRNLSSAAILAGVDSMSGASDDVKDWIRENPEEFADLQLAASQRVADAEKARSEAKTKRQKRQYKQEYDEAIKWQNALFDRIQKFVDSQQTLDPGTRELERIDAGREEVINEFNAMKSKFELEFVKLDQAFQPGIKASQKIIEGLQDQIEAVNDIIKGLQRQVEAQQRIIRGLERQKEMIQRRINAEERLNELDQRRADALSRQAEMIQRQIERLDRQNELDQRRAQALARQEEMLSRQTDQINRQIQASERQNELNERAVEKISRADELRQRQAEAINRELELMGRKEDEIAKAYDQRIDQLDEIEKAQNRINQKQQDQLDLARALSTGDIFAAAAAAQQMRQNQIESSREQARDALERSMESQIAGLRTSGGLSREQAEKEVEAIDDKSYQTQLAIRDIQDEIYERTQALIPLRDQVYEIDLQIRDIADQRLVIEDQIYEREQQRIPFLDQIYNLEMEIRDINDQIYDRNLALLPLKDQQYAIDLQIQGVNDVIFGLENEIYDIQKNRLEPLQDALDKESRLLRTKERQLQEAKDNVRVNGLTYEQLNNIIQSEAAIYEYARAMIVQNSKNAQSVAAIANMWNEVSKRINQANRAAKNASVQAKIMEKATVENFKPDPYSGLTPAQQAKEVADKARAATEARLKEIEAIRQAEVAKARQDAINFQSSFYGGGKVKKYPMGGLIPYSYGGKVSGDGGRDSISAMLTPGEFVIRKPMVDKYGAAMLASINLGSFSLPRYNANKIKEMEVNGSSSKMEVNSPVYNNYSVNVNVPNANIDANDVANKVITKIKAIESKSVRSYRGF